MTVKDVVKIIWNSGLRYKIVNSSGKQLYNSAFSKHKRLEKLLDLNVNGLQTKIEAKSDYAMSYLEICVIDYAV